MMRRRWVTAGGALGLLFTVAVLMVATTACGGTGGSGTSGGVTTATTGTGSSTGTGTGSAASCAAGDILPAVKAKMEGTADRYTIVKVRVIRCRNDYAFVVAVPDRSVCQVGVANCYDPAQVLMAWDGARWTIVNVGSDIGCASIPLDDRTLAACKALGYRVLTTVTFRMPSGNIGCELRGATLRCDIRSGLKPPPAGSCAGDWGGVVLPSHGEAQPSCASDTIYDESAPFLAYGAIWGGGGITCRSSTSGLECSSLAGHGFFLSRDSWSAS